MDTPTSDFVRACTLDELKEKGRLVFHGRHTPILLVYDCGRVFALDSRCPHMGFPLDRGTVDDGILTCHWHHARFELASGCTFDLWADDVPACPVEIRGSGDVWVRPTFGHADPGGHWRKRLQDGMAHNSGSRDGEGRSGTTRHGSSPADIVGQAALFGVCNRDEWGTGLTILTALGNLLPVLPDEDIYLALFHGIRRVAADCEGQPPRRERSALTSRPDLPVLERWLRHWSKVRHREAAERTLLTAIAGGAAPAALADLLFSAATDRVYADGGHSLDFVNKAFECLDLIGWDHAASVLPSVVGQMAAARVRTRPLPGAIPWISSSCVRKQPASCRIVSWPVSGRSHGPGTRRWRRRFSGTIPRRFCMRSWQQPGPARRRPISGARSPMRLHCG